MERYQHPYIPSDKNNQRCSYYQQHQAPTQEHFHSLMREFDPNDPKNKERTFENMVIAANKKHLNPGEQSFHYYIDSDNTVHGFIAVGNINDSLPHLIITDTGTKSSLYDTVKNINKKLDKIDITAIEEKVDAVNQKIETFNQSTSEMKNDIKTLNEVKTWKDIESVLGWDIILPEEEEPIDPSTDIADTSALEPSVGEAADSSINDSSTGVIDSSTIIDSSTNADDINENAPITDEELDNFLNNQ